MVIAFIQLLRSKIVLIITKITKKSSYKVGFIKNSYPIQKKFVMLKFCMM
ncbi:hypothetical protein E9M_07069 [Moraxella catarrhalis 46P47B1]|nr:hypothetical protein E9M_07069 [Moraxella catarrhalis 46P47B1]EGE12674.1 hypothetical protein E9K_08217 [Moraxella catarrhalis 103P14B1]